MGEHNARGAGVATEGRLAHLGSLSGLARIQPVNGLESLQDRGLDVGGRSSLYTSLAATSGALLGFAPTALAILVAFPSTERLKAL